MGKSWEKPKYRSKRKLPYVPLETELDQLIGGTSKTISTFLQVLKETGGRLGEIARIRWEDIDFKRKVISINYPEKGSDPRQVKVSSKLLAMLDNIPRKRKTVFANKLQMSNQFYKQRKRLIRKLENPNLGRIGFHSFRHWHGTMLYHKTKNLVYVQERLGHRNIKNTRLYVKLVCFEGDEYHSATAKTVEEACKLVDTGFEYVCDIDDVKLFRKRK